MSMVHRRLRTAFILVLVAIMLSAGTPLSVSAAPSAPAAAARPVEVTPFVLPLDGTAVVLTRFRPPVSRYGPGHRGVDLGGPVGGAVRASGAGIVVFSGSLAGRGVISVDHAVGIRTTYEPVTAIVTAGDRVVRGQLIGTLQAGHPSCSPAGCLHWGARTRAGRYLDPMGLLRGLRVRLLPWPG